MNDTASDLRLQARLREVDRSLSWLGIRLALFKWAYLPVLVLGAVAMFLGLLLGYGHPGPVLGGAIAMVGGAAGFVAAIRKTRDRMDDLEDERDAHVAELQARRVGRSEIGRGGGEP